MHNYNKYRALVTSHFAALKAEHGNTPNAAKAIGIDAPTLYSAIASDSVFHVGGKIGKHLLANNVVTKALSLRAAMERRSSGQAKKANTNHNNAESDLLRGKGGDIARVASSELDNLRAVSDFHLKAAEHAVGLSKAFQAAADAFDSSMKKTSSAAARLASSK